MKFSIKDLFSKCDQIPADLVTFTEETLNGKLPFLCSENKAMNLHMTNVKLMRKTVNRFAVQINLVSLWNQKGLNLI